MLTTTYAFSGEKRSAPYTCPCRVCGKTLNRKVVVEHTVNPFNKNADGSIKNRAEVGRGASAAADAQAKELQDVPDICRNCEDMPNRELLLAMAAEPEKCWPEPQRFWNSPMRVLHDRKNVDQFHERVDGEWVFRGYRITPKGQKRAAQLMADAD